MRNDAQDDVECGDDSRSWVVALAGCVVMTCITWTFRCSGVMYVAFLDDFDVSREEASWPLSLFSIASCMTGPIAGLLVHQFPMRCLCVCATLVGSAAVFMCYFAKGILEISIWLGVVQGCCCSFHYTLTSPLVASYFKHHVTTAIGILYTGPAIGSFIFIPLFSWSYKEYGLNGTFLIFSGILLNSLPFVLLMGNAKVTEPLDGMQLMVPLPLDNKTVKEGQESERWCANGKPALTHWKEESDHRDSAMRLAKKASFVFRQPMFYVIGASSIVLGFCNTTVMSVIMDFAIDQGVPERMALVLLNVVAVGDLLGRLGSGWITDQGFLSKSKMMTVQYLLLGSLLECLAHARGTVSLLVVMFIFACGTGSVVVLFTNLINDYLGSEWIPLASGWMMFFGGWALLTRPRLVGYFRDNIGSYIILFMFLGVICFISSGVWFFVSVHEHWRTLQEERIKNIKACVPLQL